jgi:hypothetical protein
LLSEAGSLIALIEILSSLPDTRITLALILSGLIASQLWPFPPRRSSKESESLSPEDGPVLITVHGTFAAHGDDTGSAWWQQGSDFAAKIQESTKLAKIIPFHWNGNNSEPERREAGRLLARRIMDLENNAVPYHLIGHSHGGNVIWHALQQELRRSNLPNLQSWTTVGTPFFRFRHNTVELDLVVPLLLSGWLAQLIGWERAKLIFNKNIAVRLKDTGPTGPLVGYLGQAALGLLALVFAYVALRILVQVVCIALNAIKSAKERSCYEKARGRHLAVWSFSDEALSGLAGATKIPTSELGLFPPISVPGSTLLARLFSPLLLPLLMLYNHLVAPLSNWSIRRRVRDTMHGNPYRLTYVDTVASHPVDSSAPPVLTPDDEAALEATSTRNGAQMLSSLRSVLGVFQVGSPFAIFRDRLSGAISFDGLVHNNYFSNASVVACVCSHIQSAPTTARTVLTSDHRRSIWDWVQIGPWRRIFAYGLILALAYNAALYVHNTVLLPLTKEGQLIAMVRKGDEAVPSPSETANPHSEELKQARHVWTTVRCSIDPQACAPREPLPDAPADSTRDDLSINMGDDGLIPLLEHLRWSSACLPNCQARDHWMALLLRYLKTNAPYPSRAEYDPAIASPDEHWYRNRLDRLYLAAKMIGSINYVPLMGKLETRADLPTHELRKHLEAAAKTSYPGLRGQVLYLLPFLDLKFSEELSAEWDKDLAPLDRLRSKLRLAEGMVCGIQSEERWGTRPAKVLLERADANRNWWGSKECQKHNQVGGDALLAAERDWRQKTTANDTARFASIAEVLWAESPESRRPKLSKLLAVLQDQHSKDVQAALGRRDLNGVLNLLIRRTHFDLHKPEHAESFARNMEQAYALIDWKAPPFHQLAELFQKKASSRELFARFLTRLVKMDDVPGGWHTPMYRLLQAKGHMGIRQLIYDECDEGSRDHCRRWMTLVDSTSFAYEANNMYSFGINEPEREIAKFLTGAKYAEGDLVESGDNDLLLRSKVSADLSVGYTAVGNFDAALRLASAAEKLENQILAFAEILATWHWAKRGGHGRGFLAYESQADQPGAKPPTIGQAETKFIQEY